MRTYAIGDIQGCFDELIALLDKMEFKPSTDKLICVGDIVNRGPKSLETLEFLATLPNCVVTLGNHDMHLLRAYYTDYKLRDSDTLNEVLASSKAINLIDWLRKQPLVHIQDKYIFVHAGVYPGLDFNIILSYAKKIEHKLKSANPQKILDIIYKNIPTKFSNSLSNEEKEIFILSSLTIMRFLNNDASLNLESSSSPFESSDLIPWYEVKNKSISGYNVIFGHWAALDGKTQNNAFIALDTGCVWGRKLSGISIDDNTLYSVNRITE